MKKQALILSLAAALLSVGAFAQSQTTQQRNTSSNGQVADSPMHKTAPTTRSVKKSNRNTKNSSNSNHSMDSGKMQGNTVVDSLNK